MQVYALKLQYFFRYGEKNNTIVFDLSEDEKTQMLNGSLTMDEVYARVLKNPIEHVNSVKKRGLEKMLGIAGFTDGNIDYSNGSGKSTVLESICFAHYDKVVRKLANSDRTGKAGISVVTKIDGKYPENMRQSFVEEIFEENGNVYRIKRGNSFTKSGKKDSPILEFECYTSDGVEVATGHRKANTNNTIDDVNANDYDVFVNTQMFAQNDAGKFLIGADKTKKEMIISLMNIENVITGCLSEIRIRKNSQEKKVDTLRTSINIMCNNILVDVKGDILSKAIPSDYAKSIDKEELKQENVDYIKSKVEDKTVLMTKYVNDVNLDIDKKDKTISELSHSSTITLVKTLQDDGKRIKQLIIDKQKQLDDQTREWTSLIKDSDDTISKRRDQLLTLGKKIEKIKTDRDKLKKDNENVNMLEINAGIEKAHKAKEVKPKYEKGKIEETEKYLDFVKSISSLQSDRKRLDEEIREYNKQTESISGNTFICKYCKSSVTKDHIDEQINRSIKSMQEIDVSINKANEGKKISEDKLKSIEDRLSKINDMIMNENRLSSQLKVFELNKNRVVEIDQLISEYDVNMKDINSEISDNINKKQDYEKKKIDISSEIQSGISKLNTQIEDIRLKYLDVKKTADGIIAEIKKLSSERENLIASRDSTQKDIAVINTHLGIMLNNWIKILNDRKELDSQKILFNRYLVLEDVFGLDGIQTRVVARVLPAINKYIKEYLDILTDGIMIAKLIINDKSEVSMTIAGASADTYEMLSGGEKMVVRLAVDIGLALLSFSKLSRDPELICLDEVFGPLDNFHKEAVFKVLEKLNKRFNRVVIITHHPDIQRLIKNNIIIERESGSEGMSSIRRIGEISSYNSEQLVYSEEGSK